MKIHQTNSPPTCSGRDAKIACGVMVLGAPGKLTYRQSAEELTIKVPPKAPFDSPACAFKLNFSGQIPVLRP